MSASPPETTERKLSGPMPAWRAAAAWAVFAVACLFLATVSNDVKDKDRGVLLCLELGEFPPRILEDLLQDSATLMAAGAALMFGLKVFSGAGISHFAGCWWPGLLLLPYFFAASPNHPDVLRGIRQSPVEDAIYYALFFCASLIPLTLARRFLAICSERGATLPPPSPKPSKWLLALALLLAVGFGYGHTRNSYVRWNHHKIYATDTGIYDQMAWMFSQGEFFQVPVYVTHETNMADYADNFNAEHYMPTMALFGPLYAIWAHPLWLWIGQHFSIGLCALLLIYLGARLTGSPLLGFAAGVAFVLDRLVNRACIEDIHPDAFVGFFLFAMLLGYHYRKFILFGASMALLMGLKEDVSFFVALLGVFWIVDQRDWKWGLWAIGLGLFWHIAASKFIIEPLRAGDPMRVLERYAWLHPGFDPFRPWKTTPDGVGDLAKMVLMPGGELPRSWDAWGAHAERYWNYFFYPREVQTYWGQQWWSQLRLLGPVKLLVPMMFLALLRPSTLIFLAPIAAAHVFSGGWPEQSWFGRYHGGGVVPFFIYGGLLGAQKLLFGRNVYPEAASPDDEFPAEGAPADPAEGKPLRSILFSYEAGPPLRRAGREFPTVRLRSPRQIALAYGLSAALILQAVLSYKQFSEGPYGGNWDKKLFHLHAHYARAAEAYALVPKGAVVAVQNKHVPHFTHKNRTYLFPDIRRDTTHIVIDTRGQHWPYEDNAWPWNAKPWKHLDTKPTYREFVHWLMSNGEWGALNNGAEFDGIQVLEKGADASRNEEIFQALDELGMVYYKDAEWQAQH